jgi:hypothetical protein
MSNPDWNPTIVIADPSLDPDKLIFEGVDTTKGPEFSVGEVAKYFFARSPSWLRQHEIKGHFFVHGEPDFTPRRRVARNARFFYLEDIERIAHALAFNNVITGARLRTILILLKAEAQIWGFLTI